MGWLDLALSDVRGHDLARGELHAGIGRSKIADGNESAAAVGVKELPAKIPASALKKTLY